MHEFLWFTISWHPFWFILGLLACVAIAVFLGRIVGMLALALLLYNVTVWVAPLDWLPWLFTIMVIVAVIGVVLFRLRGLRVAATVAMVGAAVALVISLILMNAHVLGLADPAKVVDENTGIMGGTTTDEDLQNDIDDVRNKGVKRDNNHERRLSKLENDGSGRSQEVDSLLEDLSELQGQVNTLQDLLDDHMHEKIGQSHYVDK